MKLNEPYINQLAINLNNATKRLNAQLRSLVMAKNGKEKRLQQQKLEILRNNINSK
ncbi:hypothetical protein KKG46_05470 [Patescibacteria group bacterium]|nr:hypothetical protein [Patescibacteria group bacterium]